MGKIPEETIEQIAAANDIVEVIGGYIPLKRAGANFRALCPFHQEKSPSFNVSPSRQSYHCFGCGAGGSVFRFVMTYESIDFPSAVRKLAERAGIQIVEAEFSAEEDQRSRLRRRLLDLHLRAADWFHQNLLKTAAAKGARDYLKSRGVNSEIAKTWKIGYAPDSWDALGNWAAGQSFTREELIASGLVSISDSGNRKPESENLRASPESESYPKSEIRNPKSYDRFRDRVMFPICNESGEVIAFSGRVLQADAKAAKYVNSPETPLFTKGNVLFGLHKSKRAMLDKGFAIVCEGQLDLITAFEAGVQNVIAPQGTAFTEKQTRILKRYVEEVVLCFDSDSAGQKATERSLAALLAENMTVRVAEMPPGHDPDSLIRNEGAEAFAAQIAKAKDFFDFQIDRSAGTPQFATARGKMQFAQKMAESASRITDAVMKESVIHKVCTRLEISANDFRVLLGRIRKNAPAVSDDDAPMAVAPPKLSPALSLLCLLCLRDTAARAWMLARPWKQTLSNTPDAELLIKILENEIQPDDAQTVTAFMSRLGAGEESLVSALLVDKLPENPQIVVQDCWTDLQRREIKRRQEVIRELLRKPDLPMEEVAKLQKEILDLQLGLTHITRPFSSGSDSVSGSR
jgi:DNA primase